MGSIPAVAGLLLAPGASAGRDQPALVAMDEAVSRLGVAVERIDFPYRLAGRRWPDRPKILIDTVGSAARSLADRVGAPTPTDGAGTATDSIVLGGRSMGGR
ncbi:MAG TPA: alpha/beta family hydrolase, partial [Acidimicrobiales bacterium]|nr:alpha/beta family hydrolase [Acidimicrobiales bacterium]